MLGISTTLLSGRPDRNLSNLKRLSNFENNSRSVVRLEYISNVTKPCILV